MQPADARRDLDLIHDVLRRTHERIDPHAFHFVLWGALVLVWYPLGNVFQLMGRQDLFFGLLIGALVLGFGLSGILGYRAGTKPRLEGQNTFIARQVGLIVAACVGTGIVLSPLAPASGFLHEQHMPTLWAFVYAAMAFMVGVVYTREFLWAGLAIWAAAVVAMFLPDFNGFIVGPAMGLGMIVPGVMAERRVARMRSDAPVADDE